MLDIDSQRANHFALIYPIIAGLMFSKNTNSIEDIILTKFSNFPVQGADVLPVVLEMWPVLAEPVLVGPVSLGVELEQSVLVEPVLLGTESNHPVLAEAWPVDDIVVAVPIVAVLEEQVIGVHFTQEFSHLMDRKKGPVLYTAHNDTGGDPDDFGHVTQNYTLPDPKANKYWIDEVIDNILEGFFIEDSTSNIEGESNGFSLLGLIANFMGFVW